VLEIARAALAIAKAGLERRGIVDRQGYDETRFLAPVEEVLSEGVSPAQEMLARYETIWAGRVTPLYREYAF
jgi:glutamate--cysteine ligase